MKAVFDTNVLVSAFLTRHHRGGVTVELFRLVHEGQILLALSSEIVAEVLETLTRSQRLQANYRYTPAMAEQFCSDLFGIAEIIDSPPPIPGAVPRDADDDKIIACAVAAGADYLVSRDLDLLSPVTFQDIAIITPEALLARVQARLA